MAKLSLDRALNELRAPVREGEVIRGLPCDVCSLKHTRVVATRVEGYLVWDIKSPCLDKLIKKALRIIG